MKVVVIPNASITTNNNLERRIFRVSPLYYEAIEGVRFNRDRLGMISFNNPPLCNYRCNKCLSGINGENDLLENRLTHEEVSQIIQQEAEQGARYVEMSGTGEPFVTRDYTLHIVDEAYRNGMASLIVTNGSLLTEDILRYLAERNASLLVSFDCYNSELYDQNVGRQGHFQRVLENIGLARSIYAPLTQEVNGHQIMRFGIHTIVSEFNLDQVEQLHDFVGDDFYFSVAPLAEEAGNAILNDELNNRQRERIQELINRYSDTSVITCHSSIPQFGFPVCGSMLYGLGIDYNGDILVDAHFYETRGLIGNIRDFDLDDFIRAKNHFIDRFYELTGSDCFCPMRDQENYQRFLTAIRRELNE